MDDVHDFTLRNTKIPKLSTSFSIESLIATQKQTKTTEIINTERSKSHSPELNQDNVDMNMATATATATATAANAFNIGLHNFPFYHPWLHGYFTQNQDRISQLLNASSNYWPASLFVGSSKPVSSYQYKTTGRSEMRTSPTERNPHSSTFLPSEAQFAEQFLKSTTPQNSYPAERNTFLANENQNNKNLSTQIDHNRLVNKDNILISQIETGHLVSALKKSDDVNTTLEANSIEDDFDCSDSCSDISLSLSPQNNSNISVDKNRGTFLHSEYCKNSDCKYFDLNILSKLRLDIDS